MQTETYPPFITGSRAYGQPRQDSDIDLVIYTGNVPDWSVIDTLGLKCDCETEAFVSGWDRTSFRFGSLNIILAPTETEYQIWSQGTRELMGIASGRPERAVSRDEAVQHFAQLRAKVYREQNHNSENLCDVH